MMNFLGKELFMLEISELSSSDILTPSHRFRCALDCKGSAASWHPLGWKMSRHY